MRLKNLKISLLILCCLTLSVNADEIVRYVDTGSDAGGDGTTAATSSGDNTHAYQSLNQWESNEETDLDAANNTHTVHCNRTNGGGIDQLRCTIIGWTTSVTDLITIIADDFPTDGIYDNTKYLLGVTNLSCLIIREEYVRIENLQILLTTDGTLGRDAITIVAIGTSDIRIDSCITKGSCNGTNLTVGINIADADATVTVFNTIATGFISGDNPADSSFVAFLTQNSTSVKFYNCTAYGNYFGFWQTGGTVTATINCLSFNNTDDFSGTVNADYCATPGGEGTNATTITQADNDLVTNAAGDDFSVKDASSELYQTGNGATPKSVFTDDIIGTTRGPADLDWDIGAYEFITAVPPTGGQVIMITSLPILFIGLYLCRKYKAA